MTAATITDSSGREIRTPAEIRRAKTLSIVYFLLAALTLYAFGFGSDGTATFVVSRPDDAIKVGDIAVSAAGLAFVVAAILAFLGARQWMRGFGSRTNLVLAIGLGLFALSFLAWAADGASFSLVGMFQEAIKRAVPITFGAISGVLCERTGIINIGIEGMLLGGAFTGAIVGSTLGAVAGMIGAALVGGVLAVVLAVLTVKYRVDQIIAGVVINIFVLGLTSFLTSQILVENQQLNNSPIMTGLKLPVLGDLPFVGPVLFDQNIFVYGMYLVVAATTYGLFQTRWGLRTRAVGEKPRAADTVGINVFSMKYWNVITAGLIAGFGGAYFTIGSVGRFDENMTAGRGFIGLAAMIFGRWHPVGALSAALVFGFADSLQVKLGILETPIPSEFLAMAPYIVTIIVVAGLVGRSRPPSDYSAYVKE
ncbi:MAG: ABC transporter permease [Acidimicrobiia bacterium]|nr:ABC transporter permease [Acidimicrobiia bacterium]NNF88947.1 ABC transporter permease [Acidimicrobiia bacterium]NNJ48493.1 ABC transporter permease [Acidimicrobiia bacterium]